VTEPFKGVLGLRRTGTWADVEGLHGRGSHDVYGVEECAILENHPTAAPQRLDSGQTPVRHSLWSLLAHSGLEQLPPAALLVAYSYSAGYAHRPSRQQLRGSLQHWRWTVSEIFARDLPQR
jgi:hypothetical protein